MKGKDVLIGTLGVVALIFICLFFDERDENKKLQKKNEALRDDKLKLLNEKLSGDDEITPEVKRQLNTLIEKYKETHPDVSTELKDVLGQIKEGRDIKAIRDLAKIIENLLKEKYQREPRFTKSKRITLKPLIDYAKELKFFNEKLYSAACILHQFRNEESHELAVKDSENIKMAALLGGIEIIVLLKAS